MPIFATGISTDPTRRAAGQRGQLRVPPFSPDRYAGELGFDLARFDEDWTDNPVFRRIARDVESGIASGEVRGTPTLFIDGVVYRGPYDATTLLEVLAG